MKWNMFQMFYNITNCFSNIVAYLGTFMAQGLIFIKTNKLYLVFLMSLSFIFATFEMHFIHRFSFTMVTDFKSYNTKIHNKNMNYYNFKTKIIYTKITQPL